MPTTGGMRLHVDNGMPGGPHAMMETTSLRVEDVQRLLARGALVEGANAAAALLQREPASATAHHLAAVAAVLQRRAPQAVDLALQAVALQPADARFQLTLGRAHKLAGNLGAAAAAYRQAITLDPLFAEAHVSLGITLKHAGDMDGAIQAYEEALLINPKLGVAHANLANAKAAQAELLAAVGGQGTADALPGDDVLEGFSRALALDPANAELHHNHGLMLFRARRRVDAAEAFNRALALDPHNLQTCLFLGACLRGLGAFDPARQAYEKWLSTNPPAVPAMRALATTLTTLGRNDEALAWAERAVALDPDPAAYVALCNAHQQARRLPEALAAGRKAVELSGGRADAYPMLLLCMNYIEEQPRTLFDAHAEYGRALAKAAAQVGKRPEAQPLAAGERLKVGYVSGDFVRHSVTYFIAALLEHHDRERFEITCYHNLGRSDDVTARLKALGHRWVECDGLSDTALLQRIRADGIQVLVDLSGLTAHSRVSLFAMGAAPLQLAYLGYPTVTGVQAMDARISDCFIDPDDGDPLTTTGCEPALRLPRSMFCYRPDAAPAVESMPELRNGCITFGSFNNTAKLSDRTLQLWARVMHAVPASRLLLKSASVAQPSTLEALTRLMGAHGITADRLQLLAQTPDNQSHMALYNQVDIALDTYPYNGATTTCEALWMGVPVVSLRGLTHASRMGASVLTAAGQAQWVADSEADYIGIASALAAQPAVRAGWRRTGREQLRASALFDEIGFTRSFEQAVLGRWLQSTATAAAPVRI